MSEQNTPTLSDNPKYWFPEDKERFEAWLKEWNHKLGGGEWSIYMFAKAAYKAATIHERKKLTPNQ